MDNQIDLEKDWRDFLGELAKKKLEQDPDLEKLCAMCKESIAQIEHPRMRADMIKIVSSIMSMAAAIGIKAGVEVMIEMRQNEN